MSQQKKKMDEIKFLIHGCNQREWFIYQFLIPALVKQGVLKENIQVWHDYQKKGNLQSWVASCKHIRDTREEDEQIWHLQDDVYPSQSFNHIVRAPAGICTGHRYIYDDNKAYKGEQPGSRLWYSFPCIKIPNKYMGDFLVWFQKNKWKTEKHKKYYETGKFDDWFWKQWMTDEGVSGNNWESQLVYHVDYLIGGSLVNPGRGKQVLVNERLKDLEKALDKRGVPSKFNYKRGTWASKFYNKYYV